MEAPSAGSVVLVPFPFSDLSESKLRPAVVLAEISRDDFVLCQVTSNPYADPNAVELTDGEFEEGSLMRVSYARPGKLFTASFQLFEGEAEALKKEPRTEIVEQVVRLLRSGRW
jgi:mRNA interferase MazF